MKHNALLFDLDGTLVDSLPDLRAALNHALAALDRRELGADEVRQMIGDGTHALVERALTATGGAVADFESVHRTFLDYYKATATQLSRLYRGVAETLQRLRGSGWRLAICTNKPQAATLAVIEGFGIRSCFDVVLGGDAVAFRKPDPRHLLAALEQLGVTLVEAVMVGDNENDYGAARAAGMPVILMRYGYLRVPPQTVLADAWLDDFAAVPETAATLLSRRDV